MDDLKKNAERFMGFADIYDRSRPAMPYEPVSLAEKYLGRKADTVIDLGCGTGLSALIWLNNCGKVIGIEPSVDMLNEAKKRKNETLSFKQAFAHETGVESASADVVVCSQSFHWMEPNATLKEIDRILKSGGIFMTVDCDWPPVVSREVEIAYSALTYKIHEIEQNNPEIKETFHRWDKNNHFVNIRNSGYFKYSREVVFLNTEECNKSRLFDLILSQGSTQVVLKKRPELITEDLERFKGIIEKEFKEKKLEIGFCYRVRLGLK